MAEETITVYFPQPVRARVHLLVKRLKEINGNFSKIALCLIPGLLGATKLIKSRNQNWRHYRWGVVLYNPKDKLVDVFIDEEQHKEQPHDRAVTSE